MLIKLIVTISVAVLASILVIELVRARRNRFNRYNCRDRYTYKKSKP